MFIQVPKRNMLHWFKHADVSASEIRNYVLKHPDTDHRIGSLPYDWLKNLPPNEYSSVTKGIDHVFQVFSQKITDMRGQNSYYKLLRKAIKELTASMKQLLNRKDINIKYCGEGSFKECYKLSVGKYNYALATFHGDSGHCLENPNHGAFAEVQKIFFIFKNYSHGRVVKPFMGRFSSTEYNGGYILETFINENHSTKPELNKLRLPYYEYCLTDNWGANSINGITIDIGGLAKNLRGCKNSEFRRNLFLFLDSINADSMYRYKTLEKMKPKEFIRYIEMQKFLINKSKSGIDLFSVDLRGLISDFSKQEQRELIRTIRHCRSAHRLKKELIERGEYEPYKKILQKKCTKCSDFLTYELLGFAELA